MLWVSEMPRCWSSLYSGHQQQPLLLQSLVAGHFVSLGGEEGRVSFTILYSDLELISSHF